MRAGAHAVIQGLAILVRHDAVIPIPSGERIHTEVVRGLIEAECTPLGPGAAA